jgi:hypothetical protein
VSANNLQKEKHPMEPTYDNISKWFDAYFEAVRKSQANLETVPNLKKYFASDLELEMYTSPSGKLSMSRDVLLMSFVHPGLYEEIVPQYYVIDIKQMIVAVQFEIRFRDEPSDKTWAPLRASAHYHLTIDENNEPIIRRIHYWTEALPGGLLELWAKRREEALTKYAMRYINAS